MIVGKIWTTYHQYPLNPSEAVAESELRRYNSIVEKHGDQLEEIIEALGPHPLPPWDPVSDPVKLSVSARGLRRLS